MRWLAFEFERLTSLFTFFRSKHAPYFPPAGGEGMPPSRCAGARAPRRTTKDCSGWSVRGFAHMELAATQKGLARL